MKQSETEFLYNKLLEMAKKEVEKELQETKSKLRGYERNFDREVERTVRRVHTDVQDNIISALKLLIDEPSVSDYRFSERITFWFKTGRLSYRDENIIYKAIKILEKNRLKTISDVNDFKD